MNLILVTKCRGRPGSIDLTRPGCYVPLLLGFVAFCALLVYAGYRLGVPDKSVPAAVAEAWQEEIERQRRELDEAKAAAQAHMDALALRLGQMQAHVIRLDALGRRLTKMAKLDKGEFDFTQPPAQGGPATPADVQPQTVPDFLKALDDLARQLEDRERRLNVLESLLLDHKLRQEVFPAGRPIKSGWISSYFGMRTDPFTGRREYHRGIDFAGKKGSDVIAVASGVVTWSGERYGYGKMVEIDHGNGYVTRYAHNLENLVKVGDAVKKGQRIARMGSSGRSTGPHVHFEVLYQGRVVNPNKYIRSARR